MVKSLYTKDVVHKLFGLHTNDVPKAKKKVERKKYIPNVICLEDKICQVRELSSEYEDWRFHAYETKYGIGFYNYEIKSLAEFVDKVIFNEPYTIVIWADGDKTIVKCSEKSTYDKYTGFATCFIKKLMDEYGFTQFKKVARNIIKEDECKK